MTEHMSDCSQHNMPYKHNEPCDCDKGFEELMRPVIKYLAENHHPHTSIIVTSTNAELVEGVRSTGKIMDYIKD